MLLFVRVDGNNVRIWASFARSYRFAFAMSLDLRDGNWSISTFVFFVFKNEVHNFVFCTPSKNVFNGIFSKYGFTKGFAKNISYKILF